MVKSSLKKSAGKKLLSQSTRFTGKCLTQMFKFFKSSTKYKRYYTMNIVQHRFKATFNLLLWLMGCSASLPIDPYIREVTTSVSCPFLLKFLCTILPLLAELSHESAHQKMQMIQLLFSGSIVPTPTMSLLRTLLKL